MTRQAVVPAADDTNTADAAFASILFSPEGNQNPYPYYHTLRESSPVHQSILGMWVVTRYDDVLSTLRDKTIGKNVERFMQGRFGGDWWSHAALRRMGTSLLWANPPMHTRLRRLANQSFTAAVVAAQRERIVRLLDDLLDPIAEAGGGDIVNDVAYPLPLSVVATLLGMPLEDAPLMREPMRNFQRTFELGLTAQELAAADVGAQFSDDYFTEMIERKRREPGDDLASSLIQVSDADGEALSPIELVGVCNMIIGAGFETTTHTLGNGLRALLKNPDQMSLLRARPELLEGAVEEVLRYDAPVQMAPRMLDEPRVIGGVEIPAPAQLMLAIGAANYDPTHFTEPDEFRITRDESPAISFGAGIHTCLGWRLAKLQAEVFYSTLLRRFPQMELAVEPVYRPRATLRGLESLHISVTNS
ncbi:cytochrome P450 [Streptomyces sulphureus]|uniref:cytochrome P450 n=1 Tax=Streptomyces sulphureus TaxID=47758 RepID=UPI00037A55AF|nr:cytochrome P450 [Streptomyces sulphureus]